MLVAELPVQGSSNNKKMITTIFHKNLVVILFLIHSKTRKRYSFAAINLMQ